MPSGMSSLHDNKRTGQWRPKGTHHCNLCLSSQNAIKVSSLHTNQLVIGGACPALADRQGQTKDLDADWWSQTGSNRRPQACKASALPTELWPRPSGHMVIAKQVNLNLVGLSGLEPLTSRLSGVCSNHLSYRPLTVLRPDNHQPDTRAPNRQPSPASGLMTVCPRGHTDRAELTEHSGKKEKRSRR